jgi:hypothetical protein
MLAARVLRCSVELSSSQWLIWSSVGDGVLVPSTDPFVVVLVVVTLLSGGKELLNESVFLFRCRAVVFSM